jgi:hypothetical protein
MATARAVTIATARAAPRTTTIFCTLLVCIHTRTPYQTPRCPS